MGSPSLPGGASSSSGSGAGVASFATNVPSSTLRSPCDCDGRAGCFGSLTCKRRRPHALPVSLWNVIEYVPEPHSARNISSGIGHGCRSNVIPFCGLRHVQRSDDPLTWSLISTNDVAPGGGLHGDDVGTG